MADIDHHHFERLLTGESAALSAYSRVFRHLPAPPRCKLCRAPFKGPFAPVLGVMGFRRWSLSQQICRRCMKSLETRRGGAEIAVSLLFADVRGSTALAERMPPIEFSAAMSRFFDLAAKAVDEQSGVVDHIVGDGVMAMWIPGFVGADHPGRAVAAGITLAKRLVESTPERGSFPVGVGVHTGTAYVGVVGGDESRDFTVLGDTANTAARLGSTAQAGEVLLSAEIASMTSINARSVERRTVILKGKAEPVDVVVALV